MPSDSPPLPIADLVEELLQSTALLRRRLRAEANAEELSWSQGIVMGRLQRHGPATTADLARAEGVKPQSMGASLSALEDKQLVKRTPHPSDGRQFLYSLTESGRALVAQRRLLKRTWLAGALSTFDEGDIQALTDAIHIIRRLGAS